MSDSRSDTLHHGYHKSSEQFDYFMMAIITAIVAYVVKDIPANKLISVSYDLYLISTFCLLWSAYNGFKRIEMSIHARLLNANCLNIAESRGKLMEALGHGGTSLNVETGTVMTQEWMRNEIQKLTESLPKKEQDLKSVQAIAKFAYKRRNNFLLFGVIGIALAKVLSPYVG